MPLSQDGLLPWHEYIPNQLFYSDAEEWIGDTHFRDILTNLSQESRKSEKFAEYAKLHRLLVSKGAASHAIALEHQI